MKKITFLNYVIVFAGIFLFSLPIMANSSGGEKDVVEIADLAELRQQTADGTTVYQVTGEIILTHQHGQRNQKYFQDATAAILVDDDDAIITTGYNLYDGITGLTGTLTTFNELLQFVPTVDPGAATSSDNVVEPLLITLDQITPDHQSMLIRVNAVEFTGEETTFTASTSYPIEDATGTSTFRTPSSSAALDYFNTPVPQEPTDMLALVSQYQETIQIFARSLSDFYPDGLPSYTVTFNVIDEQGDAITDAVVTFDDVVYPAGEYEFLEVPAGSYAYSVSMDGFFTRTGQVAVTGDDITVNVVLVAEDPNAITTFPWNEDFEGEDFPPATWSHYASEAGGWESTTTAHTGEKAARHNFTTEEANSWLVSPQIQLPTDEELLLTFFHRNSFMDDYGYSAVMISTGSGNPEHDEFQLIFEADDSEADYTERVLGLADYAGQVVYIAFVYQGTNAHQWFIDDIVLDVAPEAIEVDDIASLKNQEVGDLTYVISGEVIITHMHGQRNQKYIQDGTAAIVIDDNDGIITTEYNLYDGITGLTGTLSEYNNLLQFVPTEDPGAATSTGNTIEPLAVNLNELAPEHQSMLIFVTDVEFDTEDANFQPSTSYTIFDPSGTSILRTPSQSAELDYFETPIPTEPVNMIAIVSQFGDAMQIFPRSLDDIDVELSADDLNDFSQVSIYPNPFSNYIHIEGAENYRQIAIFNSLGQMVERFDNPSQSFTIDTSEFTQGLYFVSYTDNKGQQQVTKLIKQ